MNPFPGPFGGAAEAGRARLADGARGALRGVLTRPLFLAIVVIPTVLAAIYYLLIASPMYVSEARFIVRTPTQSQPTGLSSVLQGVGLSQSETDAYAAHEYVMSRDAIQDLERQRGLRALLGKRGGDFLSRFPRLFEASSNESLYRAYPRYVSVSHDSTTGISTLRVMTFRPEDAQAVGETLLSGAESVIHRLNARAEMDAVIEAQRQVAESQQQVALAQSNLARFRNREQLIDPNRSSNAGLDLVGKLSTELATLRAERAGLASSAPQSPQLPGLDDRIAAYEQQIEVERMKVAGEANSLAPKIGQYEQLTADREFADKSLSAAVASLESARLEARRKRLYLERVVNPGRPDAPVYPRRWRALGLVLASCLLVYGMLVLVIAGFREHRQI